MSTDKKLKVRQYTVVYSGNPWLLSRFYTDVELHGVKCDTEWNKYFNPYTESIPCEWLLFGKERGAAFHNHNCDDPKNPPIRLWLTESNYIEVLNMILK